MAITKEKKLEYLDKIIAVMTAQGCYAYSGGSCSYRVDKSPAGIRCAAGALIEDAHYDPDMEGCTVNPFFRSDGSVRPQPIQDVTRVEALRGALKKSGIPIEHSTLAFLRGLQKEHDNSADSHRDFSNFLSTLVRHRDYVAGTNP